MLHLTKQLKIKIPYFLIECEILSLRIKRTKLDYLRLPSLLKFNTMYTESTLIIAIKSNTAIEELKENALPGGTHGGSKGCYTVVFGEEL